jgi:hypothetical protein
VPCALWWVSLTKDIMWGGGGGGGFVLDMAKKTKAPNFWNDPTTLELHPVQIGN